MGETLDFGTYSRRGCCNWLPPTGLGIEEWSILAYTLLIVWIAMANEYLLTRESTP
jgi:hypothetical protein